MSTCQNSWCQQPFEISPSNLSFYERVSPVIGGTRFPIPIPSLCPQCRMQRRLSFRNFFNLYHRTCDLSGKKILSMYDTDSPFPVYEMHAWWSDAWDPCSYGQPVDASRPFAEQLTALHHAVPRMSISNVSCENTDYCNISFQSKNCYLVFGNVGNEDCMYGHIVWQSKDCFDCLYVYRSQFCYECVDCVECHTLQYSRNCDNCSSSAFLVHCNACRNCFLCTGLKNKEYCFLNEQLSKDAYEQRLAEINLGSRQTVVMLQTKLQTLVGSEVVKEYHGFNCEAVTGDYLYNCKNILEGYDLKNCEDCAYCATCESFLDCQDANFSPQKSEQSYQSITIGGYHLLFCHSCVNGDADLLYCDNCYASKHCFGCVGLKSKEYCILNRQYSKEEYEATLPTIINRMQSEGSWGEFFPMQLSPFGYNETIAAEYYPVLREELRTRGWRWKEEPAEEQSYMGPAVELPDDIADVGDGITQQILTCTESGKLYKILPKELAFYRTMRIPIPTLAFMARQRKRFLLRNPRRLFTRPCMKCGKEMQTTYALDRSETVYCERCYLSTVY